MQYEFNYTHMATQRSAQKKLKVTFADGSAICCSRAVQTMISALNRIGSERFDEIKLEICHRPLVAREIFPELKNYTKEICPGWYLITQSDTDTKLLQLKEISRALNLDFTVEADASFETTDAAEKRSTKRPKKRLSVTFPDGENLCSDSYRDTFANCIVKLDPNRLAQRNISFNSKPLFTASQQHPDQRQIADYRWLFIPSTSRDAAKLLRVISLHLSIPLTVDLI